jgi:rare lipoprotein A
MRTTTRTLARRCALLAVAALAAGAPTAVPALASGGAEYVDEEAPDVGPDGSSIAAERSELLGRPVEVTWTLPHVAPGGQVAVQRQDRVRGWETVATVPAGEGGAFAAQWRASRLGRQLLRAVPVHQAGEAQAASAGPLRAVTVFRPVTATYFGPGLWGRRTACGQKLTKRLVGVAHRTLPCGTPVALLLDGRTVTVPVVDRGPFKRGVSYDLTQATARLLGVEATVRLGAVSLR